MKILVRKVTPIFEKSIFRSHWYMKIPLEDNKDFQYMVIYSQYQKERYNTAL